jgi:membrane protease YdiL (CAAX protease family)
MVLLGYVRVGWMRLKKQPRKYASSELMQKLSYGYLFPETWTERRWWILVGITAGVCEEVLFRGFVLHYLHSYPWQLNLTLALLLSAIIFGAQHLYQGAKGVASTTVAGVFFGLLFLLSGSLLLPILLHALMDLRLLVILRPPERSASAPA